MIGMLARLFGGQKAVEQLVKAGIKGVDALKYTKEERTQDEYEARQKLTDQTLQFMKETTGYELARRVLAFVIVGIWAYCLFASVTMVLFAPFAGLIVDADTADKIQAAVTESRSDVFDVLINFNVIGVVMLVILFYFRAPSTDGGLIAKLLDSRGITKNK